jgi:serine/threonine protein kinase
MIIFRALNGAQDLATTIIGTPYYMSPEVFSNKPYHQKVSLNDSKEPTQYLIVFHDLYGSSPIYGHLVAVCMN